MTDRLLVLLSGVVIGELQRDGGAEPSFGYLPEYVSTGKVSLSARLPIQTAPHSAARVRPYLAGLLPENLETRRAWAAQLGVDADDAFSLLSTMGWDCPGAVQFCRDADLEQLRARDQEHVPVSDDELGARIRALAGGEPSWTMQDEHWSLGGQQAKFALARLENGWHTAHGAAATTHIVKPGIRHLHHQALLEHITMAAATNLGLDVATTAFARFDDEWAIVIERFDRTTVDNRIHRLHQEDFAQACGRMPTIKHETQGGPTLTDMGRVLSRESTDLSEDRRALADFLIFNLVAGAPDGHAKNAALLRPSGAVHMAPLFDLATGLAHETRQVERRVAVAIGGEREASRIHRQQWDRAAKAIGLDSALLVSGVAALASAAPSAFEAALHALPSNVPGVAELNERLLPALDRQVKTVIDRL